MTKFLQKHKKLASICLSAVAMLSMFTFGAFASTPTTGSAADMNVDEAVSASQSLFNQVTGVLNFGSVAKVLGIGIGAGIGIWLAWWGLRKLIRVITTALQKGKLSV